jgi:hypothetical protein
VLSTAVARAEAGDRTLAGGAHVAYGVGGCWAREQANRGFRQHLDLAAVLGPGQADSAASGVPDAIRGPLFGASSALGFGAYPSYLLADAGYGVSHFYLASAAFVELGARLHPSSAPVLAARGSFDLVFLNAGVRVLGSVERAPELGLWFLLGIGQY